MISPTETGPVDGQLDGLLDGLDRARVLTAMTPQFPGALVRQLLDRARARRPPGRAADRRSDRRWEFLDDAAEQDLRAGRLTVTVLAGAVARPPPRAPAGLAVGRRPQRPDRAAADLPGHHPGGDVDLVVTEYGIAHLTDPAASQRAGALIVVAHPDDRPALLRDLAAAPTASSAPTGRIG